MGNKSQTERAQRERYLRWLGVAVALTGWGLWCCWQRRCLSGGGRFVGLLPCPEVAAPPASPVESESIEITAFVVTEEPEPEPLAPETPPAPEPAAPARDDLKRIEGIGAKVAALLDEVGIATFAQLAAATPEHLRELLRAAELRFMEPETWPQQAALAAKGDWEALAVFQSELKGGRRER